MGSESALSQSFAVNDSGQYVITWFDSSFFIPINPPPTPYTVTLLDSSSGTVVTKTLDANASALGVWTQHSIQVSLAVGTYTLVLSSLVGPFDNFPLIDDVSVAAVTVDQACPCSGPVTGGAWRNHGQYVSCVAKAAEAALNNGSITEDQRDAIVEDAAQSSCGKN